MEILAQQVLKLGSYFYLGHGRIERDRFNSTSIKNRGCCVQLIAMLVTQRQFCLRKSSQFFASFVVARFLAFLHQDSTWFCLLQVLASLLYRWLMDTDRVCSVCEAKLSSESQRSVAMFAEIVWHVLVNLGRTEGWWDHRVLLFSGLLFWHSQGRRVCMLAFRAWRFRGPLRLWRFVIAASSLS